MQLQPRLRPRHERGLDRGTHAAPAPAGGLCAPPRQFLADIAKIIDTPWEISAGGDLDFPGVVGERTFKVRMGNAYMARLQYAATKDARVTDGFMRVAGLMDPPQALMRPAMLLRVLRHAVRRPAAGESWLAGKDTTGAAERPTV
ncbi:hypothetical protein Pflav_004760 [Phytohabitans flavus]|uniref:Uncharacterized protein n=1 Tax=Phytohabitans flavus TaxID=1076124 RepID=A0A6F8XJS6_9ACTN|nr:hypothetical protein Pflav_004760 [Phytohabitans flavus]